ncbi:transposase [uncultured Paraglaciecola sp.]|uniref:transposase n=1 Tax=uncultured Paraglaciecola sp. TaxID=1765024 RepID=UPI00261631A3|nr:transposase [uncultured Paraglaciecola sp.]
MPRDSVVDVPEHVIQRINNRQVIFVDDGAMKTCITWLKEYTDKFYFAIHARVLMTNPVHILCSPDRQFSVSKTILGPSL